VASTLYHHPPAFPTPIYSGGKLIPGLRAIQHEESMNAAMQHTFAAMR